MTELHQRSKVVSGGRTVDNGVCNSPTPTTMVSITVGGWGNTPSQQQHLLAGILGVTTLDGCWCKVPLHPAATKGRLNINLAHPTRLQKEEQSLILRVAVGTNKEAEFSECNNQMLCDGGADRRT